MKYIIAIMSLVILTGCGDGWSTAECYQAVQKKYPDSQVSTMPKHDYAFLVLKPDGTVLIAKTMSLKAEVTKEIIVFPALENKAR